MEPTRTLTIDVELWDKTQCELYRLSTTYFNQDSKIFYLLHALSNYKPTWRALYLKIGTPWPTVMRKLIQMVKYLHRKTSEADLKTRWLNGWQIWIRSIQNQKKPSSNWPLKKPSAESNNKNNKKSHKWTKIFKTLKKRWPRKQKVNKLRAIISCNSTQSPLL